MTKLLSKKVFLFLISGDNSGDDPPEEAIISQTRIKLHSILSEFNEPSV